MKGFGVAVLLLICMCVYFYWLTLCLVWLNVPIVQGEIFPSRNISFDLLSLVLSKDVQLSFV